MFDPNFLYHTYKECTNRSMLPSFLHKFPVKPTISPYYKKEVLDYEKLFPVLNKRKKGITKIRKDDNY